MRIENRTGYDTEDFRDFFSEAFRAYGVREPKEILLVAAPARSRGCAEVGHRGREGKKIVFAVAAPNRFRFRRWIGLTNHELEGHSRRGYEHENMPHDMQWSTGPVPAWAKRFDRPGWPRYLGRAPDQMAQMRRPTIFRSTGQ